MESHNQLIDLQSCGPVSWTGPWTVGVIPGVQLEHHDYVKSLVKVEKPATELYLRPKEPNGAKLLLCLQLFEWFSRFIEEFGES